METNTAELIDNLRRSQAENGQVEVKAKLAGSPSLFLKPLALSLMETVAPFFSASPTRQKVYSRLKVSTHRQSMMHPLRQSVPRLRLDLRQIFTLRR